MIFGELPHPQWYLTERDSSHRYLLEAAREGLKPRPCLRKLVCKSPYGMHDDFEFKFKHFYKCTYDALYLASLLSNMVEIEDVHAFLAAVRDVEAWEKDMKEKRRDMLAARSAD